MNVTPSAFAALAAALTAAVLASACASNGQVNPEVMQIATAPLTCSGAAECDLWWQRAHSWVEQHSRYEIESANDTLIQTAGPRGGRRALAFQITKTANPDGSATIGFAAHCDSSLGCKPNPWEAGADFKRFVRSGTENVPEHAAPGAPHVVAPEPSAARQSAARNAT